MGSEMAMRVLLYRFAEQSLGATVVYMMYIHQRVFAICAVDVVMYNVHACGCDCCLHVRACASM